MSFKGISISLAISLAFAVPLTTMLIRGTLILTCTQQAVSQVADVSSRDAQQQAMMGELMLRTETRDRILHAFADAPARYNTKMHEHPSSVRFTVITDNTAKLKEARTRFESSLQTLEAKALAREWPAMLDAPTPVRVNGRLIGMVADAASEVVTLGPKQVRPVADPHGAINTAFITGSKCREDCLTALLDAPDSHSGAESELLERASA